MAITSAYLAFLLLVITLANAFIRLNDQRFGMGIMPPDLHPSFTPLGLYSPFYQQFIERIGRSRIVEDKDAFRIYLDVQPFKPDEVEVKAVDDHVQVEGKHEGEKDERGVLSTQIVRRYWLPEGVKLEAMAYEICPDGVLIITVPREGLPEVQNGNSDSATPKTTAIPKQTNEENSITQEERSETQENEEDETS